MDATTIQNGTAVVIVLGTITYISNLGMQWYKTVKDKDKELKDEELKGLPLKASGGFTHDQCPVNPSIMTTLATLSTLSDTTIKTIGEIKEMIKGNHEETKGWFDEVWLRLRKVEDTASIHSIEIEHLKKR